MTDAEELIAQQLRDAGMNAATTLDPMVALLKAISWSNANLYFDDCDMGCGEVDRGVAADILRGLEHIGWKLVPVGEGPP